MKAYGNVKIKRHSFLGLELDGDEWSASGPGRFTVLVRALLFMVPLCLVPALALLFFYVSTSRSMCAVPIMAVFSSSLTSLLLLLLLLYYYYYSQSSRTERRRRVDATPA